MEIIICCSPIWGSLFYAISSLATFWREMLYFLLHHIYLRGIVTCYFFVDWDFTLKNVIRKSKKMLFPGKRHGFIWITVWWPIQLSNKIIEKNDNPATKAKCYLCIKNLILDSAIFQIHKYILKLIPLYI